MSCKKAILKLLFALSTVFVAALPARASNTLCIQWLQTNFPDSCARTGMQIEGTPFVYVNGVPVPFFTASQQFMAACPNPHFTQAGFSCGGGGFGPIVQQQLFQGCFDKVHLLLGDNNFYFGASVSDPLGLFGAAGRDNNYCTHMIHSVLLKLATGEDVLLFGVTHAGIAVSGEKNVNFALAKIDPVMAAELRRYMDEVQGQLGQLEGRGGTLGDPAQLQRQIRELDVLEKEVKELQKEAGVQTEKLRQKMAQLQAARANLASSRGEVDAGKLLSRLHAQLQTVHSSHIDSLTIPELLKLILQHKDSFRERDLACLLEFVQEISERAKGMDREMARAMKEAAARIKEFEKKFEEKFRAKGRVFKAKLQNAEGVADRMYAEKVRAKANQTGCDGSGPRAFQEVSAQALASMQRMVSGNTVIDRPGFLEAYYDWVSGQALASNMVLASTNICREDVVALEQTNQQVKDFVSRYYDEEGDWFRNANIPDELKSAVQSQLDPLSPARAQELHDALNLWSYGSSLSPQQQMIADSIFVLIAGFHAESTESRLDFDGLMAFTELLDAAVAAVKQTSSAAADLGLGFVPLVGDFKDLCEAVTGRHMCSPNGNMLSTEDRLYAGLGMIAGSGVFWKGVGKVAKGEAKKLAGEIRKKSPTKFVGPRARGYDWNHIFKRHSADGIIAKQRTKGTVFHNCTEKQIQARVKAAWGQRKKIETQGKFTGAHKVGYRGTDPVSGQTIEMWFDVKSGLVDTAFPVKG